MNMYKINFSGVKKGILTSFVIQSIPLYSTEFEPANKVSFLSAVYFTYYCNKEATHSLFIVRHGKQLVLRLSNDQFFFFRVYLDNKFAT